MGVAAICRSPDIGPGGEYCLSRDSSPAATLLAVVLVTVAEVVVALAIGTGFTGTTIVWIC